MRQFFLVLSLCLVSVAVRAETECQSRLLKLINRSSPMSKARHFEVGDANVQRSVAPFQQSLTAEVLEAGNLKFSVVTPEEFSNIDNQLKDKGFWTIFFPSDANSKLQVGHFGMQIDKSFFTRNVDEPKKDSMVSVVDLPHAGLGNNPAIVVQFFELSPKSTQSLKRFFHDRVWFHHQDAADYRSQYVGMPFTKDAEVPCGESCVSFTYPYYMDRWLSQRPELQDVRREMGTMRVTEVPSRQIFLNTESPAYRGTFIIAKDKAGVENALLNGAFNHDPMGGQLLFKGPAQRN